MENITEIIYDFISTHEATVAHKIHIKEPDRTVDFTRYGNTAGRKALFDVINMLDKETQTSVIEMMKSKRVLDN